MDQGNLVKETDLFEASDHCCHEQFMERATPQQIIQNLIMTVLGLLKSGKLRLRRTID